MAWVALAIVVVLVPYTYITLHYRKPGPAFRPYQDTKDRANVMRLLSAGFRRVPLDATRPVDVVHLDASAADFPAPGGLPAELDEPLIEKPTLPVEIAQVKAAATLAADAPYIIQFTSHVADQRLQLGGAFLYLKDNDIVITPDFEHLHGELLARNRDTVGLITIPPGTLKPGHYHVTLAGERSSRAWSLQVH